MQQTQAAQTDCHGSGSRLFGDENGRGIAHDNEFHPALPVDDQTDLPGEQAGECGQFSGLIGALPARGRIAALAQTGQRLHFTRFEAGSAAFHFSCYGQILIC